MWKSSRSVREEQRSASLHTQQAGTEPRDPGNSNTGQVLLTPGWGLATVAVLAEDTQRSLSFATPRGLEPRTLCPPTPKRCSQDKNIRNILWHLVPVVYLMGPQPLVLASTSGSQGAVHSSWPSRTACHWG